MKRLWITILATMLCFSFVVLILVGCQRATSVESGVFDYNDGWNVKIISDYSSYAELQLNNFIKDNTIGKIEYVSGGSTIHIIIYYK